MKSLQSPRMFVRRSWARSALIISLIVILIGSIYWYNARSRHIANKTVITSQQQLHSVLLDNVGTIQAATQRLNESLDKPHTAPDNTAEFYVTQLKGIATSCQEILDTGAAAKNLYMATRLAEMLRQAVQLCGEAGPLASYSSDQYQAIRPLMNTSHELRRYERWPLFSHITYRKMINALHVSERQLRRLPINDSMDFGSSTTLLSYLAAARKQHVNTRDLAVLAANIRTAQQQVWSQRVGYWRTSVGINELLRAQTNQLRNLCGYLPSDISAKQLPTSCQELPAN